MSEKIIKAAADGDLVAMLRGEATDYSLPPTQRAERADALEELGYTPPDLYRFVPVSGLKTPDFLVARYPVTNVQYARFLSAPDFSSQENWMDFPMFDENTSP
jgi:formylglycine-generating enzyme required for sulfatase activity